MRPLEPRLADLVLKRSVCLAQHPTIPIAVQREMSRLAFEEYVALGVYRLPQMEDVVSTMYALILRRRTTAHRLFIWNHWGQVLAADEEDAAIASFAQFAKQRVGRELMGIASATYICWALALLVLLCIAAAVLINWLDLSASSLPVTEKGVLSGLIILTLMATFGTVFGARSIARRKLSALLKTSPEGQAALHLAGELPCLPSR